MWNLSRTKLMQFSSMATEYRTGALSIRRRATEGDELKTAGKQIKIILFDGCVRNMRRKDKYRFPYKSACTIYLKQAQIQSSPP